MSAGRVETRFEKHGTYRSVCISYTGNLKEFPGFSGELPSAFAYLRGSNEGEGDGQDGIGVSEGSGVVVPEFSGGDEMLGSKGGSSEHVCSVGGKSSLLGRVCGIDGVFCGDTRGKDVCGGSVRRVENEESVPKVENFVEKGVDEPVVCVSDRTKNNRARRAEAKERKKARQAGMRRDNWRELQKEEKSKISEAQKTLEAKWVSENELAVERAKQELEMLKKRDLVKEMKKREALVMKKTEVSKVAVERAFSTLKGGGNVPGFCATVVSGASVPSLSKGSGSISPNSSVSEAEVWRMMKELEDSKAECIRLRNEIGIDRLEKLKDDETVAYTVENFTEEVEKELGEKIPGGIQTQFSNFDPSTVYVHKDRNYDEFTQAYEELF